MVTFAEGRWVRADQAGVIAYYLLLPFALAGGWLIRRRRGDLLILLAPVALVLALSLIGYGIPRFRAPAEITIVVLAATAMTRLPGIVRSRGASPPGRTPARRGS